MQVECSTESPIRDLSLPAHQRLHSEARNIEPDIGSMNPIQPSYYRICIRSVTVFVVAELDTDGH